MKNYLSDARGGDPETFGLENGILYGDPPERKQTGKEPPGYFTIPSMAGSKSLVQPLATSFLKKEESFGSGFIARHGVEPHISHGPM